MITRLSTLQFNMLRMFAGPDSGFSYMSIQQAQTFDQRPFRSMLIQEWIAFRPGKGFHATRKGRDAYRHFLDHDLSRKNPNLPLTAYFDPVAYSLNTKERKPPGTTSKRLHVVAA